MVFLENILNLVIGDSDESANFGESSDSGESDDPGESGDPC